MRLVFAFLVGIGFIFPMKLRAAYFMPPCTNVTQLTCSEVLPNGDVQIFWNPPGDPDNSFVQYEIYSSNNLNGPYSLLNTELALATNNYVHAGAGGGANEVYYYIHTISSCGGSNIVSSSDTLASIHLLLVNPNNGTADLKWNEPVSNGTGTYDIKKEYPAGTWVTVATLPFGQNNFIDIIDICGDVINYRIEYSQGGSCVSRSNIDGDFLKDITAPDVPEIVSVTVDTASNNVDITWNKNISGDTKGYILFKNSGGFWVFRDTIKGINSISYSDVSATPDLTMECYRVAAYDSCLRGVPPAPNTSPMGEWHCTVHLQMIYNACGDYVDLIWNNYVGWSEGIQTYEIYGGLSNSSMSLLGSNSGGDTTFSHAGVPKNVNYHYVIKAKSSAGKTSLSNAVQVYTAYPQLPSFVYLATATVINDSEVELHIHGDLAGKVSEYRVERSTTSGSGFVEVGTVPFGVNPVMFNDYPVKTGERSYFYQVIAIDSCGNDAVVSNEARTVYLTGTSNSASLKNTLDWNDYEGWDGNIIEYRIYRETSSSGGPTLIATVPFGQNSYIDNVELAVSSEVDGEFCYFVEAVEDINSYNFSEVALSNALCLTQQPLFYVPNAFVVNGLSGDFKPVGDFFDFQSYEMQIYNRSGQLIFETNDYDIGWNGQSNNADVPNGVYVYKISYEDGEGNPVGVKGFVTLLRK